MTRLPSPQREDCEDFLLDVRGYGRQGFTSQRNPTPPGTWKTVTSSRLVRPVSRWLKSTESIRQGRCGILSPGRALQVERQGKCGGPEAGGNLEVTWLPSNKRSVFTFLSPPLQGTGLFGLFIYCLFFLNPVILALRRVRQED